MGKYVMLVAAGVLLAVVLTAAANWDAASHFAASVTGEDDIEKQAHGIPEWLSGIARQQPQTADYVPIAYNGVNPYGINTFLNQEVEESKRVRQLDLIQAAGFHWIRQEFPWEDIEIHAKGDFSERRNAATVRALSR